MKEEGVLPAGFNGTFTFTNWTKEEFRARWNKKEYIFPPESTVPLVVLDATPIETQNIRKKFARDLAEREYFKSDKYKGLESQNPRGAVDSFKVAIGWNASDLNSLVQRALEPMAAADIKFQVVADDTEDKLHKDDNGKPITPVVDKNTNLAVGVEV